jgi:GNAT superfamily N-acetyltransferase
MTASVGSGHPYQRPCPRRGRVPIVSCKNQDFRTTGRASKKVLLRRMKSAPLIDNPHQKAAAMQLTDIEPGLHVIWDDSPSIEIRNNLIQKIDAFIARTFPSKFERFALLLQDDAACLKGGVSGLIYCDWLFVDGLWIDDRLRHRGIGTELMTRAETHAVARGCHSAWLDTFQARGFYEALGYEAFGMLDNYPAGQKRHFLRKRLIP